MSKERGAAWLDAEVKKHLSGNTLFEIDTTNDEGKPRAQAAVLTDIGKTHELFHDGGEPYARVGGGAYSIASPEYREILGRDYYRITGKGANRNALADATSTLAAIAKFDGAQAGVYLRVGAHGGGIVIDSGDPDWSGYHITDDGWRSVAELPVHFRRSGKPLALPRPTAPDFSRLWNHINIADEHRVLVAAWLLAALRPHGPYPVLALVAEQGSGKSHTSRTLKALTDPSATPLRSPPRDERDLLVAAVSSRVLALDNLSGLDHRLSDALCRLSTGGALSGRKLYTDSDETLIEVQRPVILNGIDDIAARPDLAERCLHISLPTITKRVSESDMQRGFKADAGAIFAALLDGVSLALRDVDRAQIARLPRMADFAKWAAAGVPALGFSSAEFIAAYGLNQADAIETGLDSSLVGHAVRRFMDNEFEWSGTSAELLRRLTIISDDSANKAWPRSPKGLVNALRRLSPSLRHVGIHWRQVRTAQRNLVELSCNVQKQVPQPPQVPQMAAHRRFPDNAQAPLNQPQVPQPPLQVPQPSPSSTPETRARSGFVEHVEGVELKNQPCTSPDDDERETRI